MKALEKDKPSLSKPKANRLDIEGEEEATSHWHNQPKEEPATEEDPADPDKDSSSAAASLALQSAFHKAGESRKGRQVDIQLDKVQHSLVDYDAFEKSFWSQTPQDTQQGHEWRKEHSITCHPPMDPIYYLEELRDIFGSSLMGWCHQHNYTRPTLVQSQTLSVALSGKDAIITASTGSGKTLAYLWPMAVHLSNNQIMFPNTKCRGLVLCPTRELALQVVAIAKTVGKSLNLAALAIIGGNMGRYQLSQELTKLQPSIIVATPGRLLDVLSVVKKSMATLTLKEVTMVVLDEADKMLQMGFSAQVTQVLQNIRPDKQALLLSATMGNKMEKVASQWLSPRPVRISVGRTGQSSEHVRQHVVVLPHESAKEAFLIESLATFVNVGRTLIFCATRDGVEALAQRLREHNNSIVVETLHGDRHQSDRNHALKEFSKGRIKVLVATDVAGRGLDIPSVATVINYDPAKNLDAHVHRVGRAGRLSADSEDSQQQTGTAYTLLTPKQSDFAHVLRNAMEREGRPISSELEQLAHRSKKSGNVESRDKWNKSGLGFAPIPNTAKAPDASSDSYYGRSAETSAQPPESPSRPAKKSRWGPAA
jgi:ATP-dependent RNA helicase DDX42